MVEIVGRDTKQVKQTSCRNCAARLEYTQSEVTEQHGTDISGTGYTQGSIKCPGCGAKVVVYDR